LVLVSYVLLSSLGGDAGSYTRCRDALLADPRVNPCDKDEVRRHGWINGIAVTRDSPIALTERCRRVS